MGQVAGEADARMHGAAARRGRVARGEQAVLLWCRAPICALHIA
jgi:hypothetical protein